MLSECYLPFAADAHVEGGDELFDVTAPVGDGEGTRCVKLLNLRDSPADVTVVFEDARLGGIA